MGVLRPGFRTRCAGLKFVPRALDSFRAPLGHCGTPSTDTTKPSMRRVQRVRHTAWLMIVILATSVVPGCRGARDAAPRAGSTLQTAVGTVEEGRSLFYQLVAGQRGLAERCENLWTELHRQRPESPRTAAYLGATLCYRAALEWWPPRKGELTKRGLGLLEAAVATDPEDVEVRFLRGMTSRRLPAFIGRGDVARADLAYAANAAAAEVTSGRLDPQIASAALYHYGLMCEEDGNGQAAYQAWNEAARLGPDTIAGKRSLERLHAANSAPAQSE